MKMALLRGSWLWLSLTLTWTEPAVGGAARRETAMASAPTATERFVIDQIVTGRVANLTTAFSNESARVIRGAFLEDLVTGARKDCEIHRNGVQIEGAVVRDLVDVRNAEIARDIRLLHCRFAGGVDFSKCHFMEGLSIEECVFDGPANFSEMKVERALALPGTSFRLGANFSQTEIVGSLQAGRVAFEGNRPVNFANVKIGRGASLTNASFAGPVDFQFSRVADNLRFDGSRFTEAMALANFEGIRVEGGAGFGDASFAGFVSFKDARFANLDLRAVRWPEHAQGEWLWLNGATYQRISAGEGRNSQNTLLQLVDRAAHRSAYSTDVYSSLVEFYRREGYPREANQFFIAQKRRERDEILHGFRWWWSLFLDWFVGYGRSPERALFWSAAIILAGLMVFRPERMEARTTNLKADHYSPLWYSIDLFLPLVKLQDAEMWKPRDGAWFARLWSRLHTMLGWALIPIAVAAWTGMLER